jgi:hypothetical protein
MSSPVKGHLTMGNDAKSKLIRAHLMKMTAIQSMRSVRTRDQDSTPAHVMSVGLVMGSHALTLTSAVATLAKTEEYALSPRVIQAPHRWVQLAMLV